MPAVASGRAESQVKIDVLIPVIEKDLGTLPYVVSAVRKQAQHAIGSVYIVSPKLASIIEVCRRNGWKFVDERTVLPITKDDIKNRSSRTERAGWVYQQLLKLNGDRICKARFFLVVDADTVFIQPHRFRIGGKTVMYCRNWSRDEYFNCYRRLMKEEKAAKVSFVTHYMLFERAKLAEMKRHIESLHGCKWYTAILRSIDRTKPFSFSEYETYGNFLYTRYRNALLLKNNRNIGLQTSPKLLSGERLAALRASYRSLSFHKRAVYKRNERRPQSVEIGSRMGRTSDKKERPWYCQQGICTGTH